MKQEPEKKFGIKQNIEKVFEEYKDSFKELAKHENTPQNECEHEITHGGKCAGCSEDMESNMKLHEPSPNNEDWEVKQKEDSELAVFWDEMAKALPKSIERSALGDEKIFIAFKSTYLKIKIHLLSLQSQDLKRRVLDSLPKEASQDIKAWSKNELDFYIGWNRCLKETKDKIIKLFNNETKS
jgi:hypothetical protein